MHDYIERLLDRQIQERLKAMPAVAILGPRQCGKSTLARHILTSFPNSVFLDLELPSDLQKLREPELFLQAHDDVLLCLDEIQRAPELFSVLRGVIDRRGRNGQFLFLGSASRDLIRQSSETLAGRLGYLELAPFVFDECAAEPGLDQNRFWLRGGYPRSQFAPDDEASLLWRLDFIRTFVERDVLQIQTGASPQKAERLLQMLAHTHGQTVNYSKLGASLDMNDNTVRHYLDLLEGAFLVRVLKPFHENLKKRLVKAPKAYIRDSGLLHALLGIRSFPDLFGHPAFGSSWEGMVIENILSRLSPPTAATYFRTATGEEIDLVLECGRDRVAVECKASAAPGVSGSLHTSMKDIQARHVWVVAPVGETYPLSADVTVCPLDRLFSDPEFRPFVT